MASAKRRNGFNASDDGRNGYAKRAKKDHSTPKEDYSGEAETDSDPIIESDTASESGADDGVSWPEDGEPEDEIVSAGAKKVADVSEHGKSGSKLFLG